MENAEQRKKSKQEITNGKDIAPAQQGENAVVRKETWTISTNRDPYWDGTYHECFSRQDAFKKAVETYISDRVRSGRPTKKPLVIKVVKYSRDTKGFLRRDQEWHIAVEIKRGKWEPPTTPK